MAEGQQQATQDDDRVATRYVILHSEDGRSWEPYDVVEAPGKPAAIKAATTVDPGEPTEHRREGHWKAVPESSWKGGESYVNETKVVSNKALFVDVFDSSDVLQAVS